MNARALLLLLTLASVAAQAQGIAQRLDDAQASYERGHYRLAFERYAGLADEGHCDAARIAAQMARWGSSLYAASLQVDVARLQRWRANHRCATPGAPQWAARP